MINSIKKEDEKKEYKHYYKCGLKMSKEDSRDYIFEKTHLVMSINMPHEFDILEKCPPITRQGSQGSCLGHSASACRSILEDDNTLDLSKAFLYIEARILEGNEKYDIGCTLKSVCKVLHKMGVPTEKEFPYNEEIYDKIPSQEIIESAKKYKIKKYNKITTIQGIKECLYQYKQAVLFGMHTYSNFYSDKTAKKGVVSLPSKHDSFRGEHSALIVGFKDATLFDKIIHMFDKRHTNQGYFLCRNSYGNDWGLPAIKGYFLLPYEYIESEVFELWSFEK
jgi:C1A family cysteine protease